MGIYKFKKECQEIFRNFCYRITKDFNYPTGKFIKQFIQGILATESVNIRSIARYLNEPIDLKKVEERLRRHLDTPNLGGKLFAKIRQCLKGINLPQDTVIALDLSDIQKPHAKKLDGLMKVRDGSEKKIGKGYWLIEAIAAFGRSIIPLHKELYSFREVDSENKIILNTIQQINEDIGQKPTYVMDRGADRVNIIAPLLDSEIPFVIRCDGTRNVLWNKADKQEKINMLQLAKKTVGEYSCKIKKGKRWVIVKAGIQLVSLPCRPDITLCLITIRWRKGKPFMLLTNILDGTFEEIVTRTIAAYQKRWRIEEVFRHHKKAYKLESVNVRTLTRLKNVIALFGVAMHCLFHEYGRYITIKGMDILRTHEKKMIKRMPNFIYYITAHVIMTIMKVYQNRATISRKNKFHNTKQLALFDCI